MTVNIIFTGGWIKSFLWSFNVYFTALYLQQSKVFANSL